VTWQEIFWSPYRFWLFVRVMQKITVAAYIVGPIAALSYWSFWPLLPMFVLWYFFAPPSNGVRNRPMRTEPIYWELIAFKRDLNNCPACRYSVFLERASGRYDGGSIYRDRQGGDRARWKIVPGRMAQRYCADCGHDLALPIYADWPDAD